MNNKQAYDHVNHSLDVFVQQGLASSHEEALAMLRTYPAWKEHIAGYDDYLKSNRKEVLKSKYTQQDIDNFRIKKENAAYAREQVQLREVNHNEKQAMYDNLFAEQDQHKKEQQLINESVKKKEEAQKKSIKELGKFTAAISSVIASVINCSKYVEEFGKKLGNIGNEQLSKAIEQSTKIVTLLEDFWNNLKLGFWSSKETKDAIIDGSIYNFDNKNILNNVNKNIKNTGLLTDAEAFQWVNSAFNQMLAKGFNSSEAQGQTSALAQKALNISKITGSSDMAGILNAVLTANSGDYKSLANYGIGFDKDYITGWMSENGYDPTATYTATKESEIFNDALGQFLNDWEIGNYASINAMKQLGFEVNNASKAIQAWEEVEAISAVDTSLGKVEWKDLSDSIKKGLTEADWKEIMNIEYEAAIKNLELNSQDNMSYMQSLIDALNNFNSYEQHVNVEVSTNDSKFRAEVKDIAQEVVYDSNNRSYTNSNNIPPSVAGNLSKARSGEWF